MIVLPVPPCLDKLTVTVATFTVRDLTSCIGSDNEMHQQRMPQEISPSKKDRYLPPPAIHTERQCLVDRTDHPPARTDSWAVDSGKVAGDDTGDKRKMLGSKVAPSHEFDMLGHGHHDESSILLVARNKTP